MKTSGSLIVAIIIVFFILLMASGLSTSTPLSTQSQVKVNSTPPDVQNALPQITTKQTQPETKIGAGLGTESSSISTRIQKDLCFGHKNVNDSFIPGLVEKLRIAVVQPLFTSTPYSQYRFGSFYAFYTKYHSVGGNITTDLGWLSTDLSSGYNFYHGWGLSYGLYQYLTSQSAKDCGLVIGKNVQILSDVNASQGALFYHEINGSSIARFDVVVVPFSEYVTLEEYQAYMNFVAGGGTLELIGSDNFQVQVSYNSTTNKETLVKGHGWAFDGVSAWHSVFNSWEKNDTNWVGSTLCCFHRFHYNGSKLDLGGVIGRALAREFGNTVFKSYFSHEENSITNMTGTSIISIFANQSGTLVAAYTHEFRKGVVVALGVFGDDIVSSDASVQYFLLSGMISRLLSTNVDCSRTMVAVGSSVSCTAKVIGWTPTGIISWSSNGNATTNFAQTSCALLPSSGACSATIKSLSTGFSVIKASYSGDSNNTPSSGIIGLRINKAPTSISLDCSPPAVSAGKSTTCEVDVSGFFPSGIVSLVSGENGSFGIPTCALDSSSSCSATYAPSNAGNQTIEASYSGDANNDPSIGTFVIPVNNVGSSQPKMIDYAMTAALVAIACVIAIFVRRRMSTYPDA